MFQLTKFTGESFFMNPETILWVEEAGDTVIHLINGECILVKEKAEEFQSKFLEYKQTIHKGISTFTD